MNERKIEHIDTAILVLTSIFVIMVSIYAYGALNEPEPIPILIKAPEANTDIPDIKNSSTRFYVIND